VTQPSFKSFISILTALFFSWLSPIFAEAVENGQSVLSPPTQYVRQITIEARDHAGQPVKDVKIEISSILGKILSDNKVLQTDHQGQVRFEMRPVLEEPLAGHSIQDRFILYRTSFKYQLTKSGFISQEDEIEDVQEFSSFQDPLYRVLDREPAKEPLVIPVTLYSYQSFLTSAGEGVSWPDFDQEKFNGLVDKLKKMGEEQHFILPLEAMTLPSNPEAVFKLNLTFMPHFDPAELGLLGAGAVLFRGPFLTVLSTLKDFFEPTGLVETIWINILTKFQSRTDPRARPVQQVFTFRFPASQISFILDKGKDPPFGLDPLQISVNGQGLDLSEELNKVTGETGSDDSF